MTLIQTKGMVLLTGNLSSNFSINIGLRQGDTDLAYYIDSTFRILVAKSGKTGLKINGNETKYMVMGSIHEYPRNSHKINSYIFERVSSFKYLGSSLLNEDNKNSLDIKKRIKTGKKTYFALQHLQKVVIKILRSAPEGKILRGRPRKRLPDEVEKELRKFSVLHGKNLVHNGEESKRVVKKKVDSENIKNEKIKAVNNLENSAGEILMCDVDVAMLSERLPPPPTFHDTTHQPPSSSCQTSPVCLVDTIPSSSGTDATAFQPANGMTNLNT
ncbi:hypothetical protein CWI37_0675p0010, partial [Hamiltosporidium tvaerminnensis]